jgi:AcrR family transcriptional regulator
VSASGIPALTRKERTFQRIQEEAMRLFLDKGYEATTVEEIAAAAGVSHMTVFRHFPTKEALVLTDRYDPIMRAAIAKRPATEPPLDSIFYAIVDLFHQFTENDIELARRRSLLARQVPSLQQGMWVHKLISIDVLEEALRERGGFAEDSLVPRLAARIATAIFTEASERWVEGDDTRPLDEMILDGFAVARSLLMPMSPS